MAAIKNNLDGIGANSAVKGLAVCLVNDHYAYYEHPMLLPRQIVPLLLPGDIPGSFLSLINESMK